VEVLPFWALFRHLYFRGLLQDLKNILSEDTSWPGGYHEGCWLKNLA
jgi:hypothetical protein